MRLLSRGVRHLVLMIAVTGTATASDERNSMSALQLSPDVVRGQFQHPACAFFASGNTVTPETSKSLERSSLAEIVVGRTYLLN